MDPPFVSVVILNFNGKTLLEECLPSVLAQTYSPFEVLLVDNGSSDGSAEFVRERFPSVRLIKSGRNLGYAGGNNLGVSEARGDHIVLLNNDTRVEEGWLAALVDGIREEGTAVVSSLILTEGVPSAYYERNGSINLLGHNIMRVFRRPDELFYCGGASLLYRRDLLGLPFDETYFAYAEDVFLSLRARFAGYGVRQVSRSVIHHKGGVTAKRTPSGRLTMLQERNRILNTLLFFSWPTIVKASPLLMINVLAKIAAACLSRRFSLPGIVSAYWWIVSHPEFLKHRRKELRAGFRSDEREVLAAMTSRLVSENGRFASVINGASLLYHRIVGLRTIEIAGQ